MWHAFGGRRGAWAAQGAGRHPGLAALAGRLLRGWRGIAGSCVRLSFDACLSRIWAFCFSAESIISSTRVHQRLSNMCQRWDLRAAAKTIDFGVAIGGRGAENEPTMGRAEPGGKKLPEQEPSQLSELPQV